MSHESGDVTRLLRAAESGDSEAVERLYELVYSELRRIAGAKVAGESPAGPQATSLVHEAYLRLLGSSAGFENRAHFFGAAAEAMRRILVDQARERHARKRGAGQAPLSLDDAMARGEPLDVEILDVDRALARLEERDPGMAQVVKLRFFAGMTVQEVADALSLSPRSVDRTWASARAWLQREIKRG